MLLEEKNVMVIGSVHENEEKKGGLEELKPKRD